MGALAIPLIKRQIEPNRWFGIRFAKAYVSDENWYRINRYGGWQILFSALILSGLAIIGLVIDPKPDTPAFFTFLFAPLIVLAAVAKTWWFSRKL